MEFDRPPHHFCSWNNRQTRQNATGMVKTGIVIPIQERCQYLQHSVRTALQIDDGDSEIAVSDNACTDDTKEMIAEFDDPRLIYVNTGVRLSMRENFNHAFLATSGEYLIYFGDDDGVLPKQFPFLRDLIKRHKPDGASWNRATYGWPISVRKCFAQKNRGRSQTQIKSVSTPALISEPV